MSGPARDRWNGDPEEVDRRFNEIVAGLRADPPPAPPPLAPEGPARPDERQSPPPERLSRPHEGPSPSDWVNPSPWPGRSARGHSHLGPGTPDDMATDHRSYEAPEEDDHFVPPPTPPLPAGDLHFWAIVVGLAGGPLLLLFSAVIPLLPRAWSTVGLLVSIAGFVLLVLRQPRRRGPDDGDLGAQV